nr:hypothetical protein GCM10023233_06370 [Brevibacterium otitidis]
MPERRTRRWVWVCVLAAASLLFAAATIAAFRPGGYNSDVFFQLKQAEGLVPFNDWHPVIQAWLWQGLIALTGTPAAMLALQVGVLAAAAFGLSWYLYDTSGSRRISLLGLAVVACPWVLTFAGMLWKDSQMMVALFAAVSCTLLASRFPRAKWPLLAAGLLLLVYGVMVRKNAAFAAIPLAWLMTIVALTGTRLASWAARLRLPRTREGLRALWRPWAGLAAGTLVLAGLVAGGSKAVDVATQPEHTSQLTQVFLDDVAFTMSTAEIKQTAMPERLRTDLLQIRTTCPRTGGDHISDAYWRCYRPDAHPGYRKLDDADAIAQLWADQVTSHPLRYLRYRTLVYSRFLFATDYQFQTSMRKNSFGIRIADPQAHGILAAYVNDFGVQTLRWPFQTWFWFAAGFLALGLAGRMRSFRRTALCLSASSVIYLLGYFPIVPAFNFRYTYWSAAALTIVAALGIADALMRRRSATVPEAPAGRDVQAGRPAVPEAPDGEDVRAGRPAMPEAPDGEDVRADRPAMPEAPDGEGT